MLEDENIMKLSDEKFIGEKRKSWQSYNLAVRKLSDEWQQRGFSHPPPQFPPMPSELQDMTCGAKTKSTGQPCKRRDIYSNGRCKLHGGLSTGPKTINGKRKSAKNGFQSQKMQRP